MCIVNVVLARSDVAGQNCFPRELCSLLSRRLHSRYKLQSPQLTALSLHRSIYIRCFVRELNGQAEHSQSEETVEGKSRLSVPVVISRDTKHGIILVPRQRLSAAHVGD